MHARLIVLVDRKDGDTSEGVRISVTNRLIEERFAGEGGLFYSPPADWFVIGGRWSGDLTLVRLDQEKLKSFDSKVDELGLGWISREHPEGEQRKKSHSLFKEFFPDFSGKLPVFRDGYRSLGYGDDAQILDEKLYEMVSKLSNYSGGGGLSDGTCFVDLDAPGDELSKDALGEKWVVVVDFHY